ncbi:Cytochrome P450 4V2 [Eumeta japonica]|uniref:Cytochrome P450 4V2 n=1 Tax=Eumeta variegata TaxID=151549 RepID=A0A4C1ZD76_EUMVA|nr:Cytochrome P450 4V2 [Eumeta japonica]
MSNAYVVITLVVVENLPIEAVDEYICGSFELANELEHTQRVTDRGFCLRKKLVNSQKNHSDGHSDHKVDAAAQDGLPLGVLANLVMVAGQHRLQISLYRISRKFSDECMKRQADSVCEEMFVRIRQLIKEHGDRFLVKIFNRRILHLHHPDDVEIVLSHSRNIRKSKPYRFLEPWLGQGLLVSYGSKWHRRRKILTPTFHFNILKHFSAIIEGKTKNLISTLKSMQERERDEGLTDEGRGGKKGTVVEVMPLISTFTLHTICGEW